MTLEIAQQLKENAQDLVKNSDASPQDDLSKLLTGETLKRSRENKNLSIDDVAKDLRIKALYIEALEQGDFDRLPGQAYVTGFIKTYAEFLGLSGNQIVENLRRQTGRTKARPNYTFPVATDDQKLPSRLVIVFSTCVLLLLVLSWNVLSGRTHQDEVPPLPKDLVEQMTPPAKPKPAETAAPAEAPKAHPLVLKAVQDSWIEIKDSAGKAIFSRVLKAGEEFWVPDDGQIYSMTTGNAGGLKPVINGKEAAAFGAPSEVKRHIALDPAKLNFVEKSQ